MTATGVGFATITWFSPLLLVAVVGTLNPSLGRRECVPPHRAGASSWGTSTPPPARTSSRSTTSRRSLAGAVGALLSGLPEALTHRMDWDGSHPAGGVPAVRGRRVAIFVVYRRLHLDRDTRRPTDGRAGPAARAPHLAAHGARARRAVQPRLPRRRLRGDVAAGAVAAPPLRPSAATGAVFFAAGCSVRARRGSPPRLAGASASSARWCSPTSPRTACSSCRVRSDRRGRGGAAPARALSSADRRAGTPVVRDGRGPARGAGRRGERHQRAAQPRLRDDAPPRRGAREPHDVRLAARDRRRDEDHLRPRCSRSTATSPRTSARGRGRSGPRWTRSGPSVPQCGRPHQTASAPHLTGPHPHHGSAVGDPDLAVADLAGARGFDDGVGVAGCVGFVDEHLDPDLGHEVHGVFRASVDLGVPAGVRSRGLRSPSCRRGRAA